MALFETISNFLSQYLPDFSTHTVEYLLLFILVIVLLGVFRR